MEDWKAVNGSDWEGWCNYIGELYTWIDDLSRVLLRRVFRWQNDQSHIVVITPSTDHIIDITRSVMFEGKQVYDLVLKDPGVLPRVDPRTFKVDFPGNLPSFLKNKFPRAESWSHLMAPRKFDRANPPKGWSASPREFQGGKSNPSPIKVASRWKTRQAFLVTGAMHLEGASKKDHLLSLFHHLHHKDEDGEIVHEIHHCGGKHKDLPYTISHCKCGKHRIDMQEAEGHGTETGTDLLPLNVKFSQECPEGGWHIESGEVVSD
jgi:hypothetical protein